MLRRLALTLAVFALLAGVGAAVASADNGVTIQPVSAMADAQKAAVKTTLLNWNDSAASGNEDLLSGMFRAREAATLEPDAVAAAEGAGEAFPIVAAGVVGVTLGWKIGNVFRGMIAGHYSTDASAVGVPRWQHYPQGSQYGGVACPAGGCWFLLTSGNWGPWESPSSSPSSQENVIYQLAGSAGVAGSSCNNSPCYIAMRTDAQMRAQARIQPLTQAQYDALPSGQKIDSSGFAGPSTLTDAQAQAALDAISAGTSTGRDTANDAAVSQISTAIVASEDFTFLQPQPNETYATYLARLQAAGYVGTATSVTEATTQSGYGPNAVTRIEYQGKDGLQHVLDPLHWPVPAPNAAPNTAVTVRVNTSDATPAPTDGGGGWTPSTATPGPIDFTPLTGLSFGCKFPYGIICYAQTVTGWFDVTPQAPDFNIAINDLKVGSTTFASGLHYDVNLDVADSYMALIRDIVSVVLWIGAVWVFVTRILGLGFGDPGEALDEAYD